jgi:hypothetical protein
MNFVVYVEHAGYQASLELHKIYRVLRDVDAGADGNLRVVDESGEGYPYEADRFLPVDLPAKTARALIGPSCERRARPANLAMERTGFAGRSLPSR